MTTQQLLTLAQQLETELRTTYIALATIDPQRAQTLLTQAVHAAGIVEVLRGMMDHARGEPQYRMLEEGEEIEWGDQVKLNGTASWILGWFSAGNPLPSSHKAKARRPIVPVEFQHLSYFQQIRLFYSRADNAPSEQPEYRMLEVGEEILEGDEWKPTDDGVWSKVCGSVGCVLIHSDFSYFRRRVIPAAEFQQLSDFREKEVQS